MSAHGYSCRHARYVRKCCSPNAILKASQSVSQTLHTTTTSIFAPLLRYHLSCGDPEDSFTVLRRLLTALAHHCKTAEQFSPLSGHLTEQLACTPKEDSEQLRRLLEVIVVPCSVRQGSRMSGTSFSCVFNLGCTVLTVLPFSEPPFYLLDSV